MKTQVAPTNPMRESLEPRSIENFPNTMAAMLEEHRPSRMPFFGRLAALPGTVVGDPSFLGQIHLIYQSAMHATRAAVYYLPHLDSPALRKRKLQIFIDDDGLPGGDTHHYQLTRAFLSIGAKCLLDEEEFGEPAELCHYLEAETAHFVQLAPKLYSRSLGPWCAIEICLSIGCGRLPRPCLRISRISSTSIISRTAFRKRSKNGTLQKRSRSLRWF